MPGDPLLKAVGIIPARGGSKGIPRKNVRLLAGQPLIAHSIKAARGSRLSAVVVTTDDDEIAAVAQELACPVIRRPADLAADTTPMPPVLVHALATLRTQGQQFDYMVLLQPTAPLRRSADIDACLRLLQESGADTVVSVAPVPGHYHPDWQFTIDAEQGQALHLYNGKPWDQLVARRQNLATTYTRNGAIYACRTALITERQTLYGANVQAYIMPAERSVNIDGELDFALAELLLTTGK